jgi:hypothetical protein
VPPEHEGYYRAYKSWQGEKKPLLIETESRVYHSIYRYAGEPKSSKEIRNPGFFPMDEFEPEEIKLFPPFEASLSLLSASTAKDTAENNTPNSQKPLSAQAKTDRMNSDESTSDGGPGSGRYPKGSGEGNSPKMISGTGANTFQTGFSKPNLDAHFSKQQERLCWYIKTAIWG